MVSTYFSCDVCKTRISLKDSRIHCLDCADYDLCASCAVGGSAVQARWMLCLRLLVAFAHLHFTPTASKASLGGLHPPGVFQRLYAVLGWSIGIYSAVYPVAAVHHAS
ncbi:hypothetical protein B0H14DRAFT_3475849 [Mycena olivaceomarginata]|nr:hypothetical protein B0H14DRAFT_3475849 [Mycena olivaceomarginata]